MHGWLQTPTPPPLGAPQQNLQRPLPGRPANQSPHTMFTIIHNVLISPDVAPGYPVVVYTHATATTPLAPLPPAHHDRAGAGTRF